MKIRKNENGNTVVEIEPIVIGNTDNLSVEQIKDRIINIVKGSFEEYIKGRLYID